jgi:hypothetical protein
MIPGILKSLATEIAGTERAKKRSQDEGVIRLSDFSLDKPFDG